MINMDQTSIDSTLVPEVKDQVFVTTSVLWKMHNVTYFGLGSSEPPLDLFPSFTSGNSTSRLHECPHCDNALNSSNAVYNDSTFPTETIPYSFSIVLIALYTFTTLAAVIGNSLAIIVFAKGKRSNTDLRSFLINLAVADLIMAIVCIPFTFAYQITENWIFPDVLCPIVQCCQQVSVLASVCTNTSIGIDRLVAVKFPLRKRVTNSRSKVVILCIWILAWSLGVIPLVKSRTVYRDRKLRCEENWATEQSRLAFGFFIMIITYFLPVTILSVTYAMIGRQLWKHKLPGNADDHRDAVQLKSKRKVSFYVITLEKVALSERKVILRDRLVGKSFGSETSFKVEIFPIEEERLKITLHWVSPSIAKTKIVEIIETFAEQGSMVEVTKIGASDKWVSFIKAKKDAPIPHYIQQRFEGDPKIYKVLVTIPGRRQQCGLDQHWSNQCPTRKAGPARTVPPKEKPGPLSYAQAVKEGNPKKEIEKWLQKDGFTIVEKGKKGDI
uniref:G-protein coupled receptors family 1 profile domain-containing protein n=1 Tax=Biomphalaria glabrata TaxID=6526 RepID=A0A2C9JX71_BIOGL